MSLHKLLIFSLLALAACSRTKADRAEPSRAEPSRQTAAATASRYQLACDATSSTDATNLFCVRIDTRSGDVRRVSISSLPTSNGPTALAEPGPAGLFQLVCRSTSSDRVSEFFCLRMNTETGELLLINLPKVPVFPTGSDGK